MRLFITGFLQVFLVSVQTVLLANYVFVGVGIFAFLISFVWTFNVKKIAFGSMWDKVVYSSGAMVGSVLGLTLTYLYLK